MPIDTHGLHQQHVGKRLRVTFADGQTKEINIYDLIAANGTRKAGETYWAAFDDVQNFQVLGD